MRNRLAFAVSFSLFLSPALSAQRVEPTFVREAVGLQQTAAAPRLADREGMEPAVTLGAAAEVVPEEIEAIRLWNERRQLPAKIGFTRSIGHPIQVRIAPAETSIMSTSAGGGVITTSDRGTLIWSGSVRVARAHRMRIHLQNVNVPPGTTFWTYGAGEAPQAFGTELIDEKGDLYVPSVGGDVAYLEVEVPQGSNSPSFIIRDILELLPIEETFGRPKTPETLDDPSCLVDRQCVNSSNFDAIDAASRATAHLQYVKNGGGFVCSGGLVNDTDTSSVIPYLLTANHCFSAQSSATSLEAFWDYKAPTCQGPFPNLNTVTKTNGATLLATNASTDFTFVRMNSIPSNRALLGWDSRTSVVGHGTKLFRISHPFPDTFSQPAVQAYSTSFVSTTVGTCSGSGRPNYLYSTAGDGGLYGGSSGSPVLLAGGYIVGQLKGSCGVNPSAGCDVSNSTLDGAFSTTYASISQYLNPSTSAGCTANSTTACMLNNRFKVTVRYRGAFDNSAADTTAQVKSVTGFANPTFETAFFYFNNDSNIEMIVKILDQGNKNSQGQATIDVLTGSATPLRAEVTIQDTLKGVTKVYSSNFGAQDGKTEFSAFVK